MHESEQWRILTKSVEGANVI